MTSRDFLNQFAGCFGYALEKKAKTRLAGRDLHEDIGLILGKKAHPVIFDLGANEGQSIRHFLRDFHQPQIVSFEPCEKTFTLLKTRFGDHPGVRLVQAAAGETEGEAEFNVYERSDMNSLLTLDEKARPASVGTGDLKLLRQERVRVVTLDAFCARENFPQIDLLKMDCQGAELGILRGATRLLTEKRIRALYLEVMFQPLYQGQAGFTDYCRFLQPFGMELTGFYKQAFRDNHLLHADACFSLVA